ncbi:efflux RND transporter periplasmic adaptor subunit (plasmid) [Agrobacterium tumefaciens]|jgi:membrane fusion protein (multidrug efflux system)|uniref:efflux RND transporter periplasmic adaptor subunit n=1 Tax=Agrobacterium TaxID=357 RepID=UPI00080FAE7F|nr:MULTISPECIES: efflux RND transporter periplasmic adaptor subunit [Agrobacterium]NSY46397.1 efflux RND transporter periplasmic adaptor subunit [Agrobacterium tumefaciens]NSZ76858.1 efflux RND transporter periplasmic adaptor subunit [Agrobacterium tumefaciens]NSZ87338.1 efflux RND transporter periplasmic adaptor subunit [Agrobacterium tumefaciens]UZX45356.1 efflux RND transporter periplasmic adaptor subunit [Agrobacterium sp. 13-2099-1-2]WCA72765.1 efflux RND transporter periplasmic adaptor s
MAFRWTTRMVKASLLLVGCSLTVMYLASAGGTVDANERLEYVVASVSQVAKPLELTQTEVAKIERASMVERLRVSGELQPVTRVVMRAKTGGNILDLAVREGERVRAGDIILKFETDDLQSTLLQRESDRDAAAAELTLAMQALNRMEQLAAGNVVSKEQHEKAKSEVSSNTSKVRSLSAQVDIARVALRDADITAPFDGVVASRVVEAGSRVSADAELLTIVDTSILEAKVLVSTRDIVRVAAGQTVQLQIDGMEGQTLEGRVARINPVADNGTRFVPVYLRLSNHDGRLWGGMFSTGSILVREKTDALVVPAISLRKDETGDYLLKLHNGHLQRQSVTVGQTWNGGSLIEIADGLVDGDTIVTVPLPELRPDVAVTLDRAG